MHQTLPAEAPGQWPGRYRVPGQASVSALKDSGTIASVSIASVTGPLRSSVHGSVTVRKPAPSVDAPQDRPSGS